MINDGLINPLTIKTLVLDEADSLLSNVDDYNMIQDLCCKKLRVSGECPHAARVACSRRLSACRAGARDSRARAGARPAPPACPLGGAVCWRATESLTAFSPSPPSHIRTTPQNAQPLFFSATFGPQTVTRIKTDFLAQRATPTRLNVISLKVAGEQEGRMNDNVLQVCV